MSPLRFFLCGTSLCLIFFSASAQIINEEAFPNLPYKENSSSITQTASGFFISGASAENWSWWPPYDYWGTTSQQYCILSPVSPSKQVIFLPDVGESRFWGLGGGANIVDNSFVVTSADSLFALWSNKQQTYTDVAPNIFYDSLPRLALAKFNGSSLQKILTLQNGLHPSITSDKNNTLHFVWEQISPIDSLNSHGAFSYYTSTLYYQSRNSNGEFSAPVEIGKGFYPSIKTRNDTVHIIFLQADSSNQPAGYWSYSCGIADHFSAPVRLQAIVLNPYAPNWGTMPQLLTSWNIDSSGAIHIVWHYDYSTISQQSYIIHYSKEQGVYIDSLNDMHAQVRFMKNGDVGIYSIAPRNDSSFLQYYISKAGSPLQKIAEHYLRIINLILNQILVDTAGNEHVLLTNGSASYLLKYAATDSSKLFPLSSAYTIFPSSYVDETNRVWLTGKRDSTNVLLNFSLDDVGKAEDFDFPLHVGDVWQYSVNNMEIPDPLFSFVGYDNVKADIDTVMPNGKSYLLLQSDAGYILKSWYLRKDGFRVHQYSPNDSAEHLLYDFSKGIGDTLENHQVIQDIVFANVFGFQRITFKMFGAGTAAPFFSIADSIGIIEMSTGISYTMGLTGAVINGKTYGTIVGVKENPNPVPTAFSLSQNYPNPFNPTTRFRFTIAEIRFVTLKVYDVLGREVATLVNEKKSPGTYEVEWNASNVSSGVYFYRFSAGSFVSTKKMILMR